jgi:hypothetical protein
LRFFDFRNQERQFNFYSFQNPSTPVLPTTNSSWNGSAGSNTNLSSSNPNPVIAEKKQEPHTPPVTPQQTIATAS